jgi:predicted lipoprotein with Yx(FWY)xxD motif
LLVIGAIVAVAAVVGVAIAIAATGSSGGSAASTSGATVSAKKVAGAGTVLVDSKGRALYRSDQERKGMVLCTGSCLSFWQPLTVKGTPTKGSSLKGKLAVVKRPDGGQQVTYNGKLLYSFKLDSPGQLKGDNFQDAFGGQKFHWHVVRPVGTSSAGSPNTTPTPTYTVPGY